MSTVFIKGGPKGGATVAAGQVQLSTTSGTVRAARPGRKSITIRNMDSSISVYIGAGTVSSSNGFLLKAGESVSVDTTAAVNGIAASGTPSVCFLETYD